MIAHFLSLPAYHPIVGFHRAIGAQFVILATLVAIMCLLASAKIAGFKRIALTKHLDASLGSFTYPLYLYHYVVLIVVMSLRVQYTYAAFIGGMALATLYSIGISKLIDPLIDQLRDKVRGRRLVT